MLQYKSKSSSDGLGVIFHRKLTWALPIAGALCLLSGASLLAIVRRFSGDSEIGVLTGLMMALFGVLCGLVLLISLIFLAIDLKRYRFRFSPTGIHVTTAYLGLPVRSEFFDQEEVYDFGFGHLPHTSTTTLAFAAAGTYYQMAYDVTEGEAEDFILFLRGQGMAYSPSKEPLHRRSAAHTFLG
jgi:hypothetical protein